MADIVDILIKHGKKLFTSLVFQIPFFVVMLLLWINPGWLKLKQNWILKIQEVAPLIVIFICTVWIVEIFIWIGKKLKFRENVRQKVRGIVSNNHIYSSYLENNFLYTIYNEELEDFSFEKICSLSKEKDWTTPEGIEETITSFLESGILERKKELYSVPDYVWKELALLAKSKQLRWKR